MKVCIASQSKPGLGAVVLDAWCCRSVWESLCLGKHLVASSWFYRSACRHEVYPACNALSAWLPSKERAHKWTRKQKKIDWKWIKLISLILQRSENICPSGEIDQTHLKWRCLLTLDTQGHIFYWMTESYCYKINGFYITPTLKSQGVRILSGGIRTGGGGEDWLSKEMPKLSLIWNEKYALKANQTKRKTFDLNTVHKLHLLWLALARFCQSSHK